MYNGVIKLSQNSSRLWRLQRSAVLQRNKIEILLWKLNVLSSHTFKIKYTIIYQKYILCKYDIVHKHKYPNFL
jgi:hypothetical protein